MMCLWKELLSILPVWLAGEVDRQGRETLQELRLRTGQPPQLIHKGKSTYLYRNISSDDINFCINTASRYSPWAAQSISQGYITAPGGHRIGLCGTAVLNDGAMTGIRTVQSLCIRVARDFPGISQQYSSHTGSILIIGPPGSGKTTFLRDLIRQVSTVQTVSVVDERCELFPSGCFNQGTALDVLSGCPKTVGINMLLRAMNPETIAVDEITSADDCDALMKAGWCGVRLIATAHASSVTDLRQRPLYEPLLNKHLFNHILTMRRDKTIHEERMIL